MINNPILRGFAPDPSIMRNGDDYYIATSTFEWWPGVRIFHSKNLVDFDQIPSPLRSYSQLDMTGDAPSCGVWAPDLTFDGKRYFLTYTDVKTQKYFFLWVRTSDDEAGDVLKLIKSDKGVIETAVTLLCLQGSDISLYIKVEEGTRIRFGYGSRGSCTFIDKMFSTSVLCDEYCRGFTGSQFGTSLITRVEYISAEEYNNRYHNKIYVSYLCA